MTDVKLFTHAFSANVSSQSARSSMTGSPHWISANIIPGTCVGLHNANRVSQNNNRNTDMLFSKVYTIKFRQYINLQRLRMGRALMEVQSGLLFCIVRRHGPADPAGKHGLMQISSHSCFKLILLGGGRWWALILGLCRVIQELSACSDVQSGSHWPFL